MVTGGEQTGDAIHTETVTRSDGSVETFSQTAGGKVETSGSATPSGGASSVDTSGTEDNKNEQTGGGTGSGGTGGGGNGGGGNGDGGNGDGGNN